ncbi:MAG: hypothetical protein QOD49_2468 [Actinomycetota bacterium]|nr:hypothetical protein [Actinomycetota bacterium]
MGVEIRLLGRFSARRDGREIPPGAFGGRLARTLLRILISRRGAFVTREYLTEALWPKAQPADPVMNVNVLVQRARSALGDQGLIVTGPGGYSFAGAGGCVIDAEVFLAAVGRGRALHAAGDHPAALQEFRLALEVWAGEPLAEDTYEEWAQEFRTMLLRARLDALEGAAALALATGDAAQAVACSELAVVQEPLREAAHLLLATTLAASGDPAAALAALDRMRRRLADELGLDPSEEADRLQLRILRGEPVVTTAPAPPVAARSTFGQLPFLGREHEVAEILARLADPFPGPILVLGPPGAGKSRLIAEVGARSRRPVVAARGFRTQQEEPWGLARDLITEVLSLDASVVEAVSPRAAQALADVVPLVADLREVGSGAVDPESRRSLAREGAIRIFEAIAAKAPLVVVDDVQWADATSLALLEVVARRVPRIGLVIASRSGEASVGGSAATFLGELARAGGDVLTVTVGPLPRPAVVELVGEGYLAEVILRETEGTPLAIAEVLRALVRRGLVEADGPARWRVRQAGAADVRSAAHAGQRRAIEVRVGLQTAREGRTLSLLALLGREAPARLLAAASGRGDEGAVLDDLDALAGAGLVRLGERGWAMHHDVIGEVVIEGLESSHRGRLHGMLAKALDAEGAEPAEVAGHLVGAGDPDAAADAFADAARRGLERFANDEAEKLSTAGLELAPRNELRRALLEIRAEARGRRGDTAPARDDLRCALETGGADRSRILTSMAMLTSGTEDYVLASELVELALGEAGRDPAARARALTAGARLDLNLQRPKRAAARAGEALALFEEMGDPDGVADILEIRCIIAIQLAQFGEALTLLGRATRLFQDAGRLMRIGRCRSNWGVALATTGQPDEGLAMIEEALELERSLGHPAGEAYSLWARSDALLRRGRVQQARESAEEALAVARRIGHREWSALALKGLGDACLAAGDLDAAAAAYEECLALASSMPIFQSWAQAGVASVHLARGDLEAARTAAAAALRVGTPLTQLQARRVWAEIAVAGGDSDASSIVGAALRHAEEAGDVLIVQRLTGLLTSVA